MINEKAKEELTPRDATLLEDILKKGKFGITTAERELLVARRCYLDESSLEEFGIDGPEEKVEEVNDGDGDLKTSAESKPVSAYAGKKFADLKKEAKERGIITANTDKLPDIVALLEQYDGLKDGDEFQGKIAKIATQEMIDENDLSGQVEVGELFFIEKEAIQE